MLYNELSGSGGLVAKGSPGHYDQRYSRNIYCFKDFFYHIHPFMQLNSALAAEGSFAFEKPNARGRDRFSGIQM